MHAFSMKNLINVFYFCTWVYNRMSVFYLISILVPKLRQTHVNDSKMESEAMSYINIFTMITHAFPLNLPIKYRDGDLKNGHDTSVLTSRHYLELFAASMNTVDLID
jgi:hypothetical protein